MLAKGPSRSSQAFKALRIDTRPTWLCRSDHGYLRRGALSCPVEADILSPLTSQGIHRVRFSKSTSSCDMNTVPSLIKVGKLAELEALGEG